MRRSDAESRGRRSRLREHLRRRRPERSAGAASGYVPAPERRAGGRGRWRRRDRHHCSPDPAPPPRAGRRSPSASVGKESLFATARNPHGKLFGLPCSKRFCGERKKRTKVRLGCSSTTSSRAQTVTTGRGSGFACFLGKAVGKPFSLGCHRVKSCMVLQCLFQRER